MSKQIPRGPDDLVCPWHKAVMCEVCHKCPLWIQVRGTSPQGGEVDQWDCAFAWLPLMLIENANQQRHTSAALESFRNEVVRLQQNALNGIRSLPYARDNRGAG